MKKLLLVFGLFAGTCLAQIPPNTVYVYAYIGTQLPTLCNNRDLFYNVITYQWYTCGPINTWTAFGSGGGGGATIAATTNFISGSGTGNGNNSGVAVSAAGIVGLFSSCTGTKVLSANGTCQSVATPPTIATTSNALTGDGAGNAIAATGTATNFLRVNGTSAAASGPGYGPIAVGGAGTVTVSAVTHGQGVAAIPACYDNSSPRNGTSCNYTEDDSGNIIFTFAGAGAYRIK